MGVYTVTRDDFRNARRSYIVLGVIGAFTGLVALVFASEMNVYDDAYRTLWDVSFLIFLAFPLFVAPLTYLSIAGDRSRGSIKYVLGLPNSRSEYVLGKYASRAAVAVAAVLVAVLVGFVIAAATFVNDPNPARFAKFAGASVLFALAITGTFVAVSATCRKRSRAMFGVIGAYFLLGPFWMGFLPIVSLPTMIDTVTSTLGVTLSDSTRVLIRSLSPFMAYLETTEVVYAGVFDQYGNTIGTLRPESDALGQRTWFNALVMIGWATIAPLVGYLKFRTSELG